MFEGKKGSLWDKHQERKIEKFFSYLQLVECAIEFFMKKLALEDIEARAVIKQK